MGINYIVSRGSFAAMELAALAWKFSDWSTGAGAVIPIHTGRQLFIDEYQTERSDLKGTLERQLLHPSCSVFEADTVDPVGLKLAQFDPVPNILGARSGRVTSRSITELDLPSTSRFNPHGSKDPS